MGKILLYGLLFFSAFLIFISPALAAIPYLANSLLQPQYIWRWVFEGIPIFKITAIYAILGALVLAAQGKIDWDLVKEKQNKYLIAILFLMHISHWLSPYEGVRVSVSPQIVLDTILSIFVMYFVLLVALSQKNIIKIFVLTFSICALYYVYWTNLAYFEQNWARFIQGRLAGPFRSPYRDGNVLSVLIVMFLPFVSLYAFVAKSKLLRFGSLLVIPFAWHSLVLMSSRAALLSSLITLLVVAFFLKSKKISIGIGLAFAVFLVYQGSLVLDRTTETISAAATEQERPVNPRLVSWSVGVDIAMEYPFLGAGVQMFEAAARDLYPGKTPHVAHNTFLNFSANTGLITGFLFLLILYSSIKRSIFHGLSDPDLRDPYFFALAASGSSLVGFLVCSVFLDLIIFEPFYVMLLINLAAHHFISKDCGSGRSDE